MEIDYPKDWNDHAAWDAYYAGIIENKNFSQENSCGVIGFSFPEHLAEWLVKKTQQKTRFSIFFGQRSYSKESLFIL
jgi:hypothetical protein